MALRLRQAVRIRELVGKHRRCFSVLGSSRKGEEVSAPRTNMKLIGNNNISKLSSSAAIDKNNLLDSKELLVFDTLHDLGANAVSVFGSNALFGTHNSDKEVFEWMSYSEFGSKVSLCRSVLKNIGVEEYSKVGIIANNRWEWACIAMACYSLNATLVPMYEAQLAKDWLYILNDSDCVAVFCATGDIFKQVQSEVLPSANTVKASLCLNSDLGKPEAFATAMAEAAASSDALYNVVTSAPSPDDLANLIYTSGTTGRPKGVELTHHNFATNVKGPIGMVDDPSALVNSSDRSLSFLPWAHSYGQTCELWMLMSNGASLGLCRGFPTILDDLQLVKPTLLFSVPTLYKRVYDGVNNMMQNASPFKQRLIQTALSLGRLHSADKNSLSTFQSLQFKVLDTIISKKVRDKFGGNLRHGFCAGAACPKQVLEFMDDIGIQICEGYGLTETSPIIAINSTQHRRVGSVGKTLPGVNVLICDEEGKPLPVGQEGEICCSGPNIMNGYYKNPEATSEVISIAPDGHSRLFHTGDLGKVDNDGYVYVTGRLKELYKLENGKYVCPTPIEEAITMSRFISQVVLCGANREYNVALIVPDFNAVRDHLTLSDDIAEDDIVNNTHFKLLIDQEILASCQKANLKKYEQPDQWSIVAPFTAANNMLTPKLSIRRHKVMKFYEDLIDQMYQGDTPPYSAHGVPHDDNNDTTDLNKKAAA